MSSQRAVLIQLHRAVLDCSRCVELGCLPAARPVVPEPVPSRIVLVGQAPGRVEADRGRPFSGRAGAQLFRWLARAGCATDADARRRIYCTSITKCFPGRALSGTGDRRPTATEVAACRPFLDRQLAILRPAVVIAVGGLAHARFLPDRPMDQLVGRSFDADGAELPGLVGLPAGHRRPWVLPLPHPSGASRWLNLPEHARLLDGALAMLAELLRVRGAVAGAVAGSTC